MEAAKSNSRRPWDVRDNETLMGLWATIGSILLIARMMNRSASSIQTQASRLGLPPRGGEQDRNRRKWGPDDDDELRHQSEMATDAQGMIDVMAVAKAMVRSPDSIISRLEALNPEEDMVSRLLVPVPTYQGEADWGTGKVAFRGAKPGEKERRCLRCRKVFWSEGKHNWMCTPCKRSDDWMSS